MNDIDITVKGADELASRLDAIQRRTGKTAPDLIKQAMIIACRTASKYTKPLAGRSVKRLRDLPARYKFRPVENLPTDGGRVYLYPTGGAELGHFTTEKPLSRKSIIKRGIVNTSGRLRGFRRYNAKTHTWDFTGMYRAQLYGRRTKYLPDVKGGKIPHYGAAKGAWLSAIRKLGSFTEGDGEKAQLARVSIRQLLGHCIFRVENLVRYAGKIAPGIVPRALNSANAYMKNAYRKHFPEWVKNENL